MENLLPSLQEIEAVIRRLGANGSYRGLPYLVRAVARVLEEPDAIHAVIKWIYIPVAQECATTASNVERDIRTLRAHIWDQGGREALEEVAGRRLFYPPTNSELIDLIAHHFRQRR